MYHSPACKTGQLRAGFTLIEMSIVLVIIGLIVGGILTGRDLIDAASQRAQITQIEKYNTAVRTFQGKYGYLPGDIPDPTASNFGFQPRGTAPGQGDGNGIIESNCSGGATTNGRDAGCAELGVFWQDLSTASLIDNTPPYVAGSGHPNNYPKTTGYNANPTLNSTPGVKDWIPTAKLGTANFVYLYSLNGINYFAVASVTHIGWDIESTANPGLTVQQAYNIDKKIDDGTPQSGSVSVCYYNYDIHSWEVIYAAGGGVGANGGGNCTPTTAATAPASTDCFGNNNTAGAMAYSVSTNGNLQNCALSFKFQ